MVLVDFNEKYKNERPGKLFLLAGPAGVGKNTLIKLIMANIEGLYYIPSMTTRAMRPGESKGNPYFFITPDMFEQLIKDDELLEWERIHDGSYYGTHEGTYRYAVENGYDIIKDIDVNGAMNIKKLFGNNAVLIFVNASSIDVLRQRLCKRGDSENSIEQRMTRVCEEIRKSKGFDHNVINDSLDQAVEDLTRLIKQNR